MTGAPLPPDPGGLPPSVLDDVATARTAGAYAVLGRHGDIVRALLPDAKGPITVLDADAEDRVIGTLTRVHAAGLFAGIVRHARAHRFHYETATGFVTAEDPYAVPLLLGALDLHLFAEGRHFELWRCLGAHKTRLDDVDGVRFAVWAPNARRVSVVGSFNGWDGRRHQMRLRIEAGLWEMFIPGLSPGALYKYELLGPDGALLPLKADPMAAMAERPPATASIVADPLKPGWTDGAWLASRAERQRPSAPLSIYEVHAASWMPPDAAEGPDPWRALARRLVPYVKRMGFTHVEFMPVMHHPFGGSWGYQPLGLFAPDAAMGSPEGFARLIDTLHAEDIGVILDWVPGHFPTDAHGLARFDGTALYENADPREGFHPDWNTLIFNLGRNEVRGFLIASALYWLTEFHADGLRVDAVASMLYRDYSRRPGEWIPNRYGGRENLEAIAFFRDLSQAVHHGAPGAILAAEESTAFPGVTRSTDEGGLGFDYKWNMGWMHDTLRYMREQPIHRRYAHHDMTFGMIYAYSEKYILPISHDEVVHGKGSLLGRMPGDDWQRFANLRAYLGFMFTHPGKKLLFMGAEFGQSGEWRHEAGLDWAALAAAPHRGVQLLVRDLNHLYRNEPALHRFDCEPRGFAWVVLDDDSQSVLAFLRFDEDRQRPCLVVGNFTPVPRHDYRVGIPEAGLWQEILNTDAQRYGGANIGNAGLAAAEPVPSHGHPWSLRLTLPPLAVIVLRPS